MQPSRTAAIKAPLAMPRNALRITSVLEVLREDSWAVVRAASAASKAADFLLAFPAAAIVPLSRTARRPRDASARRVGPQLVLRVRECHDCRLPVTGKQVERERGERERREREER